MIIIKLPTKRIRSEVIKDFYGDQRVHCFSCGNSTAALKQAGVNVVAIDEESPLRAVQYIAPKLAQHYFNCPDVSSGCLPPALVSQLAATLKNFFEHDVLNGKGKIYVPCGSGETIFALSFFIAPHRLFAVVSQEFAPTAFDKMSPLYEWVKTNVGTFYTEAKGIGEMIDKASEFDDNQGGIFIDTRDEALPYHD